MRLLPKIAAGTHTEKFGPFVDETDGFTPEPGLTITAALTRLAKNGGAFGAKNEASSGSHDENGYYDVVFNTTDISAMGKLMVAFNISGALPVWEEFMVVPQGVYNILATAASGIMALKNLILSADDATVPLQISAGATCPANAVEIAALGDAQSTVLITPPNNGYALDIANAAVSTGIRILGGSSGGIGVNINAPGSGGSYAVKLDSSGTATLLAVNSGGEATVKIVGGGQEAAVELIGGAQAGIGLHIKGGTGSGGTGEAVRIEQTAGNNNVMVIQGAPGGSYSGTVVRVSTEGLNGTGVLCYGDTAMKLISSSTHSGLQIVGGYGDADSSAALLIQGLRTGVGSVISGSPGVVIQGGGHSSNPGTSGREAIKLEGFGIADGAIFEKGANGTYDIQADEVQTLVTRLGTPVTLGDGADIANMLVSMAGAGFVKANNSLAALRARGDAAWITGGPGDATAANQAAIAALLGTPAATIAADIAAVDANVTAVGNAVATVNGKIGTPPDLGSGATLGFNMTDIAAAVAANAGLDDIKDLLFNRDVVTRWPNQKPKQYTAGTGGNQITVNTTQNGSGNTETETEAP
jgi:hypothetical protein